MKYLDEYRDPHTARQILELVHARTTRPWAIMEVCGGQTHAIVRYGLDDLLPKPITLVHGPGCPVCVTPLEMIDQALAIAARPEVIFCSFGDMLRVPGSSGDLFSIKARGGNVQVVYSPLDCLKIARQNKDRTVVFFAVGFETTAPANAMAVYQAKKLGLENFAVLVSHVMVPPAMTAILSAPGNRVQGFLGAGHVCTVMGYEEYEDLAATMKVPIVVTGFEPLDLLDGIYRCVCMLEDGRYGVENQYSRAVQRKGNIHSRKLINDVFEVTDRKWRGIGTIPLSGYRLKEEYWQYDAARRFEVEDVTVQESPECISGLILQGLRKPHDCSAFGTRCTPQAPLGPTMVSSEGACASYYHYRRIARDQQGMPAESARIADQDT